MEKILFDILRGNLPSTGQAVRASERWYGALKELKEIASCWGWDNIDTEDGEDNTILQGAYQRLSWTADYLQHLARTDEEAEEHVDIVADTLRIIEALQQIMPVKLDK